MRIPDRLRRLVEKALPWYDPEVEANRAARTAVIRMESIEIRKEAEQALAHASAASIRDAYRVYGHRVNGRG